MNTSAAVTSNAAASGADTTREPLDVSLLAWAFGLFGVLRIVAYLPTLQSIHTSGAADQHSLFTWLTFLGANVTMAMWLHRGNGGRFDRAVLLNSVNAVICAAICMLIAWTRVVPHLAPTLAP
jgi:hypothetical protein